MRRPRRTEVLAAVLTVTLLYVLGAATLITARLSADEHRLETLQRSQHLLDRALILRNGETLQHLQARVSFLDRALDQVCRQAHLPCPAPLPNVPPIATPKPSGRASPTGASAGPTPALGRASPSSAPTPTTTQTARPRPSPSASPSPLICLGPICL